MMAINLLRRSLAESRHLRQKRRLESVIGLLALSMVCIVSGLIWANVNKQIQSLQQELADKRVQISSQARFESDVKVLVEQRKKLMQEILRLEDFQSSRVQPGNILDTISQSLDPLDLWLVTMQLEKGRLALDGLAGSREDILRFSKNIDDQALFKDVTISETRAELIAAEALYSFSMNFKIDRQHVGSTPS